MSKTVKRNLVTKDLRESGLYKMKVVASKKGKGSFKRKEKYKSNDE